MLRCNLKTVSCLGSLHSHDYEYEGPRGHAGVILLVDLRNGLFQDIPETNNLGVITVRYTSGNPGL